MYLLRIPKIEQILSQCSIHIDLTVSPIVPDFLVDGTSVVTQHGSCGFRPCCHAPATSIPMTESSHQNAKSSDLAFGSQGEVFAKVATYCVFR
jgi:hypothetical protein